VIGQRLPKVWLEGMGLLGPGIFVIFLRILKGRVKGRAKNIMIG
jgi:hypothetical protein